jgi:hypothetical protein
MSVSLITIIAPPQELHQDSKKELKEVFYSFEKEKRTGENGYFIGFYMVFYDLSEDNLYWVVEESKYSRDILGNSNIICISLILKNDSLKLF